MAGAEISRGLPVASCEDWEVRAIAKIHGTYEYDDDDLTPGSKKEGGLHQNLFDADGNLKGSARFVPDEEQPGDPFDYGYVDPYLAAQMAAEAAEEERRRQREREENAELIAKVLTALAAIAYVKAKPHAQRLWRERLAPAMEARRDARIARKQRRQERRDRKKSGAAEVEVIEATVVDTESSHLPAAQAYRRDMTSAEAQARYLMALAAKAFSEEQLRLVADANIVEEPDFLELQQVVAALPQDQVTGLIQQLELNPSVLVEEGFDLASFLERTEEQVELRHQQGD